MLARPRQDAAPTHPRRHPRPARPRGGSRGARRARHRAVRARLRQPLPVRGGRRPPRRPRGRGGRDDRRRRPVACCAARRRTSRTSRRSVARGTTTSCSTSSAATGSLSDETRRRLAATAFATTAAYEAAIATWFADRDPFPEVYVPVFEKQRDLAYGENPHQGAAYYAERGARTHLLARVEQLHGKELSFNNLNDLNAARLAAREFTLPACVIVKHANPCGVAVGASIEEAYECALAADPVSAYGGVVVLNRPVSAASAPVWRSSSSRCSSRPATTRPPSRRSSRSPARAS